MSLDFKQSEHQSFALKNALFVAVSGSRLYGNFRQDSDVDIRGVFVAPREYYTGLEEIQQVEFLRPNGEKDTMFELRHFVRLAANGNPNIIEMLFVPDNLRLVFGDREFLHKLRDSVLSERCFHSFSGYAFSQLKRLQGHRNWIENPPTEPDPKAFQILRYRHVVSGQIIPESDFVAKKQRVEEIMKEIDGSALCDSEIANWEPVMALKTEDFDKAKKTWEQYLDWCKNRNEERASMEANFGYDGKYASHLIRLMLQLREILLNGRITLPLPQDHLTLLRDIREGKLTYRELLVANEELSQECASLRKSSNFRKSPDMKALSRLVSDYIVSEIYSPYCQPFA